MTDRFEVVEIVEQDAMAVLFKALDRETGQHVALRRVGGEKELAFVKTGDEGKKAFQETVELLVGAEGEGIRKVIAGGVDPIDGAPWVAYEWFEGRSFVHEPDFATSSRETREEAMEAILKCLTVLHSADLLGGWIGFENLFLKEDGKWVVELCPERMAIAKVGGIEVDHPFASSLLQAAGKGSVATDLRGAAKFFAMLKKGTTDTQKVALPSAWMRLFGWMKKDEDVNAAEALQRLQKIINPDVLGAVSEIRRKNRAITSYVEPSVDPNKVAAPPVTVSATPAPGTLNTGETLLATSNGHVTQAVPVSAGAPIGGTAATSRVPLPEASEKGKGKLLLILGAVVLAILGFFVIKKASQPAAKTVAQQAVEESAKEKIAEPKKIKSRKEVKPRKESPARVAKNSTDKGSVASTKKQKKAADKEKRKAERRKQKAAAKKAAAKKKAAKEE